MGHGISRHVADARRRRQAGSASGFTLIELLVVIAILGILAGVVVFSTRGVSDRGEATAVTVDGRTIRTAEEAFFAQHGYYADEATLVAEKFLQGPSEYTDVAVTDGGAGYTIGYGRPNNGVGGGGLDVLRLAAGGSSGSTDNGYPTPFAYKRGPGYGYTNYLFDPLLWRDSTGQALPWLARAVPTTKADCATAGVADCKTPDSATWKFTLRSNVKWHDHTAATPRLLSPEDVVFTFNYLKTGRGNTVSQARNRVSTIANVTADPSVPNGVIFSLNTPVPATWSTSVAQTLVVIPKHIWETVQFPGTFGTPTQNAVDTQPKANAYVGTGAYELEDPAGHDVFYDGVAFDANPDFFLGEPYVKRLEFVAVSDSIGMLLSGGVSAGGIGSEESVSDDALQAVVDAGFRRVGGSGGWNRNIQFNLTQGFPFDDRRFRQAVAYAIDRQFLVDTVLSGHGTVGSYGSLAPDHPMLAPGLPTYAHDPARAKALLDEIGLTDPDGDGPQYRPVPGGQIQLYSNERMNGATVDAIVQWLKDVGIDAVRVDETDVNSDGRATRGEYTMMMEGWGNLTQDPDQLRTRFYSVYTDELTSPGCVPNGATACYKNGGFSTIHGFTHARFGQLAAAQLYEHDPAARKAMILEMQQILAQEVPIIHLYIPEQMLFYPPGGFSAWYTTPGGTPTGQPGYNNKHVFITGKQFGLPAGY